MKPLNVFITIVLFIGCLNVRGQAIVTDEEFNGGTVAPAGWIFTNIGGVFNTNSNYGKSSPSLQFDATGDQVTTATFPAGSVNAVTFWAQSSTGPTTDNIVVEYFNGTVWNACTGSPVNTFTTTSRIFEVTFPNTATRLRFTYTKAATNLAFDDVTILNKTASCTNASFLYFSTINFNSCNASSCEGTDEYLTFKNGSSPLSLADLEITVPTVGPGPEGTTFCGNALNPCDEFFTTNPAYVTALNGIVGCAGFFLTPPGGIIPANARVVVFMGNPPSNTINFGTLCSSGGNYYCVFVSNTTNCTGRYSNSAATLRYTSIRNRSTGCIVERSFVPSSGSGNDGDLVAFDNAGTPSYISNPGCTGFVALPLTLLDFWGVKGGVYNSLYWKTDKEENVDLYKIERSEDALNFAEIGSVRSLNANDIHTYSFIDEKETKETVYYRLKCVDVNSNVISYPIISVMNGADINGEVAVKQDENAVELVYLGKEKNMQFELLELSGQKMRSFDRKGDEQVFLLPKTELIKGVYIIRGYNHSYLLNIKLVIH